jgi:hypothetical protein
MARDVYTADMGNPPVEEDAGILARRKRAMAPAGAAPARSAMPVRPRPNPADAGIFTADKGIQPPSPDEGPTMNAPVRPATPRQMKARGDLRAAMGMKKGGSVSSASKRADGCAQRGKTKGKMV